MFPDAVPVQPPVAHCAETPQPTELLFSPDPHDDTVMVDSSHMVPASVKIEFMVTLAYIVGHRANSETVHVRDSNPGSDEIDIMNAGKIADD